MKKWTYVLGIFIIALFLVSNVTAYTYTPYGYSPYPSSVQFTETWDYKEHLRGKNRGFELIRTVKVPSDVYEENYVSDQIYPGYIDPYQRYATQPLSQQQYSYSRYTPYNRQYNFPSSTDRGYGDTSNLALGQAFNTYQNSVGQIGSRYFGAYAYNYPSYYYNKPSLHAVYGYW